MAGSERSGVEAADALLFVERTWVLCPYPDTPPEALTGLMDLAESVLARPLTMDAQEHDAMVAMISHLPQLLSTTLMLAAEEEDATHTMLQTLAGRGFLDMTRIAASEYSVWSGILQTNREAIIRAVDRFIEKLSQLRRRGGQGRRAPAWRRSARRRRKLGPENLQRLRKADLRGMIDACDQQIVSALGGGCSWCGRSGGSRSTRPRRSSTRAAKRACSASARNGANRSTCRRSLSRSLFAVIVKHSSGLRARGD